MTTTKNMMDITNTSDAVLDAAIALKTGDTSFDFDALSLNELIELQAVTGVNLRCWIALARGRASDKRADAAGLRYESRILARQEDGGRNVG